ncbi:M48 family metallopeptidase [Nocardioides sp. YIM 152588]|uniref:M48 metallopeptidase family protein n=1 Tax=Nocardioides sp. YIM 152588 TaxID=3158259 RepID=UPI0032E456DC
MTETRRPTRRGRQAAADDALMRRSLELSDLYLGGLAQPESVRWVSNQRSRWGSCTPGDRTIRVSERLKRMPDWVVDYVLVHELAHLLEPQHDEKFWAWVSHYPLTEKAKGYLMGWADANNVSRPVD